MITFPPYRLDAGSQCLWRRRDGGEERILLELKTFAVLRYLVEHAGEFVSAQELIDAVWPNTFIEPEVLKRHIYLIRNALEDDPKRPLFIETLPRRGYRFVAPIREGSAADSTAQAAPAQGRLVGRDRALAELQDCLRMASSGQRQIVFVCGEPGIGKTALVGEFQRQAAIEVPDLLIAHGQCIEGYGGTEAYYPILDALGQLCQGAPTVFVQTLANQAPTWLVQFPALVKREHREALRQEILGATKERMLREICVALDSIAAKTPLLLVLEDLQWVDLSTVDLLSALARRRLPAKLMLIGTKRPIDSSPLLDLKQDLLLHRLCHEITLEPLTNTEVVEYLAGEGPLGSVQEGLGELIYRHSEGNPLFMVAALDHLTQRGFISREGRSWELKVPLQEIELEVPENLRHMIEAQIERLSIEEQKILEVASVAGVVFLASVCAAVVNGDPESYEDLYDLLARRRRLVRVAGSQELPGGHVSAQGEFVHALYREVLYQRQPPRRRSRQHQRIGERLEALYSDQVGEVTSELAHHFEASADWPRAVKYLRLAADAAARRYAHQEAIALLGHALELARQLPEPLPARFTGGRETANRRTGIVI